MKKPILFLLFIVAIAACKNKSAQTTEQADTISTETTTAAVPDTAFDINKIPVSDKNPGNFPFFSAPPNYSYNYQQEANPKNIKVADKEYMAVNGKLLAQEGRTFKINVEYDRSKGGRFNSETVQKYYQDSIVALGGVQVNNIEITKDEYNRVGEKELIDNQFGYTLDPNLLDRIKTYVIKTKDKIIWIQLCLLNEESGRIAIVEQPAK